MKVDVSRCRLNGINGKLCSVVLIFLASMPLWNASGWAQATNGHRKVLQRVEPEYPAVLRSGFGHFEGTVRLAATVLENGAVSKVEIKGGSPMFAKYASQAVMQWKYAPGPAQTVEEVAIQFHSGR